MYAILEIKGKQYKVEKGQEIYVDLLDVEPGKSTEINEVLLINNDKEVKIGQPYIQGAKITLKVEKEVKGEKLVAFKFRLKKRYKKKIGHRQRYHKVTVESISA